MRVVRPHMSATAIDSWWPLHSPAPFAGSMAPLGRMLGAPWLHRRATPLPKMAAALSRRQVLTRPAAGVRPRAA